MRRGLNSGSTARAIRITFRDWDAAHTARQQGRQNAVTEQAREVLRRRAARRA